MKAPAVWLAAALTAKDLKGPSVVDLWRSNASSIRQTVVITGTFVLVAVALVIWAVYIRKPRRGRGRGSERGLLLTAEEQNDRRYSRGFFGFGKRRKRRRHRSHRRNPTLAETGGLPPIRPEEPDEDADT